MLGTAGNPNLLVTVGQEHSPTHFEFWVVNGCWDGTYTDGQVAVWHPDHPWSDLSKIEILTDNQDRLRSVPHYSYQEVFENFDNVNYVAPAPKPVYMGDFDDDIPF